MLCNCIFDSFSHIKRVREYKIYISANVRYENCDCKDYTCCNDL